MSEMTTESVAGRHFDVPRRRAWLAPIRAARRARPLERTAALVLLAFIPLIYLTMLLDDATFTWLIREEHPIELLGALALLAASVACLVLWRLVREDARWPTLRRLSLLALAVVFFFGFGEEISWGERILGFGTPDSFQAANVQDETNVHNLAIFGGPLDMDRLFQLFWFVLGVIIPVLAVWTAPRRLLERLVPILPVALAGLFVLNQLFTWGFHELFNENPGLYNSTTFGTEHATFEIKETVSCVLLATGFWLLVPRHRGRAGRVDASAH